MLNLSSVSSVKNYTTDVKVGNDNNKKDPLNSNYNYKKIIINNPYNNSSGYTPLVVYSSVNDKDLVIKENKEEHQFLYMMLMILLSCIFLSLNSI